MPKTSIEPHRFIVLASGFGSNLEAILQFFEQPEKKGICSAVICDKKVYALERAKKYNIPSYLVESKNYKNRDQFDRALMKIIDQYRPKLIVLAGFMRILTPSFVHAYQKRLINIHPSLLPKYTGLNTHQRAIDARDQRHGTSVHFVIAALDSGPLIAQESLLLFENESSDDLGKRVQQLEYQLYPKIIHLCLTDQIVTKNDQVFYQQKALKVPLQFTMK
jgi:phosphoribosylglycinamide formyltransferase-1